MGKNQTYKILQKYPSEEKPCQIAEYETLEEAIQRFHLVGAHDFYNINEVFETWLIDHLGKVFIYKKTQFYSYSRSDEYVESYHIKKIENVINKKEGN